MLRNYADATRLFSSGCVAVISHKYRSKVNPLQSMGDKMLSFLSMTKKFALGIIIDDQVRKLLRGTINQSTCNIYHVLNI